MVDTVIVENEQTPGSAVSWAAILAGAAVTAAFSLLLLALGAGLGFSVMNPWSSGAAATTKAATVAGIYFSATAVLASAVGGYLTGRLRALWTAIHPHEAFFRDTAHGLIAWAIATLVGAAFLGAAGTAITGSAVQGVVQVRSTSTAPFMDRLFDYDDAAVAKAQSTGQAAPGIARDYNGDRAAANRILLTGTTRPLTNNERERLSVIVAARTGMALPDAEKRVAAVETDARTAADTARRVAMMLSFWLVAALLAGALSSCLAAWEGGAIRDGRLSYER